MANIEKEVVVDLLKVIVTQITAYFGFTGTVGSAITGVVGGESVPLSVAIVTAINLAVLAGFVVATHLGRESVSADHKLGRWLHGDTELPMLLVVPLMAVAPPFLVAFAIVKATMGRRLVFASAFMLYRLLVGSVAATTGKGLMEWLDIEIDSQTMLVVAAIFAAIAIVLVVAKEKLKR
ncbi:hypothetical protein KC614_03295 [candidate division WWE3 bacterium]|uniref:Uncharacterized protein n=1 Tax=candidate division WWE3 bacterium TaxID=2053526 RepID=A0A955RS44_UNCKA|nr:hypothetical protein [candidate division WWE3 bacterium]